jgi:metal-dependent amidase/aminoacylase/carboxypeptidase family protein
VAFEEYIAHDTLCDFMESLGFKVTRKAYGVETAFEVLSGESSRLINISAKYDAVPSVGHGCGHHLIAVTSVSAFLDIVYALKEREIPGRVQLLSCPAEENQGGNVALVRGALKGICTIPTLTMACWVVEYHGLAAHAAGFSHQGINAFDAAVASYNNIAFLRQQTLSEDHGVVIEGPGVPNTIGNYTKSVWVARSLSKGTLAVISKRVVACFEATATATGCTVEITE